MKSLYPKLGTAQRPPVRTPGRRPARLAAWFLAFLLGATALGAAAQNAPVEGKDYLSLNPPQPKDVPGKVEVVEFFGYWCPHCNDFDPSLTAWAKRQPSDVVLRYVPIAFGDSQVPLQRLYYTLEALGKEHELRSKVFAAIHQDHDPLNTIDLQADFAAKNGIDPKKYRDLYDSFSVQSRARRAMQTAASFGVDSVPTLAVDGKYTLGGAPDTFSVLDALVAAERKTLTAKP